jgi:predicted NAD/FAD-dependent oxidoreductase
MYASVARLKSYLGIDTTTEDDLLHNAIETAQAHIDRATGRTFEASADTTRYLHATEDVDGRDLWLGEDLCAITTVTNGDAVVVASNEYSTMPRNVTPYHSLRMLASANKAWTYTTDPEGAIVIVGKWAYSTTAPADIEHACTRLAAYLYRQKDSHGEADRPLLTGDGNVILPQRLPADVASMIRPYTRLV